VPEAATTSAGAWLIVAAAALLDLHDNVLQQNTSNGGASMTATAALQG
jgi:hypothetical protein